MGTLNDSWAELRAKVRGFVGARVNDPHDADDVTQDVLLKVQAHLGELAAQEKLPAWIFTAARNAVIDHYRARAVRAPLARDGDVDAVPDESPDERGDALRELTPCLARMIGQLADPYRTAMRLADIEGLDHQELADRTGVSLTAAKSRVRRARQQLREMILDCCTIDRDARGGVMDYQTTDRSARYCGCGDDLPQGRCGG